MNLDGMLKPTKSCPHIFEAVGGTCHEVKGKMVEDETTYRCKLCRGWKNIKVPS